MTISAFRLDSLSLSRTLTCGLLVCLIRLLEDRTAALEDASLLPEIAVDNDCAGKQDAQDA